MDIVQTPEFKKQVKKLYKNQKNQLDEAVKVIMKDPFVGVSKKGDLSGVRVYKFNMVNQLTLLAYEFNSHQIQLILLALGSHENFYRGLKK
jgi:mRNA-degrading endonuclease YafQ of YafQ-DinJ toxin-antitoxin module